MAQKTKGGGRTTPKKTKAEKAAEVAATEAAQDASQVPGIHPRVVRKILAEKNLLEITKAELECIVEDLQEEIKEVRRELNDAKTTLDRMASDELRERRSERGAEDEEGSEPPAGTGG